MADGVHSCHLAGWGLFRGVFGQAGKIFTFVAAPCATFVGKWKIYSDNLACNYSDISLWQLRLSHSRRAPRALPPWVPRSLPGPQVQQDEDKPRKIEVFTRRNLVPKDAIVSVFTSVHTALWDTLIMFWGVMEYALI